MAERLVPTRAGHRAVDRKVDVQVSGRATPSSPGRTRTSLLDVGAMVIFLVLGALVAVLQGQDNTWDFRAYHLYNGWALVNDRLVTDLAPAGAHGFFNPLLDASSYLLLSASPRWGTAAIGAWSGFGLFLLYLVGVRLFAAHRWPRATALLVAVFSGAGGLTVSMAGNTMNETQLLPFITGALLAAQHALDRPARAAALWAACGALLAAAVGLKFTAASYAAGPLLVVGASLLAGGRWRELVGLSAGTAGGFLLTYGWWGWQLFQHFSSPVFPLYNAVFRSPQTAPQNVDLVQMPHSALDALLAPGHWAVGDPLMAETGVEFQDFRILLGLLVAAVYVLAPRVSAWRPPLLLQGLSGCLLASYVAWALVFRVARYTVGMEVLGGFLLCGAVLTAASIATGDHRWAPAASMTALLVAGLAVTDYAQWGRTTFDVEVNRVGPQLPIPSGALVLLIDRPANSNQLPALIPSLGEDKVYAQPAGMLIRPGDGSGLSRSVAEAVSEAENIAVLHYRDRNTDFSTQVVRDLGLCLVGPPTDFATPLSGEVVTYRPARHC